MSIGSLSYAPWLRWVNIAAFVGVIVLNALASTGRLSDLNVGDVSRKYPTDITPASYAFSIWGVIYTFVALFSIYQALPSQQSSSLIWEKIGLLFSLSCVFNVLWIIIFVQATEASTWISTFFIFAIFGCLLWAHRRAQCWDPSKRSSRSWPEVLFIDCMLSLYGGWLNVACVVNVAAAFVSSGQQNLGWSAGGWTVLMLVVAALLNLGMLFRANDPLWGCVFVWAAIAIAKVTPTQEAKTTALVLASIVGVCCIAKGFYDAYVRCKRDHSYVDSASSNLA